MQSMHVGRHNISQLESFSLFLFFLFFLSLFLPPVQDLFSLILVWFTTGGAEAVSHKEVPCE
jgi:hypothetical protein